MISQKKHLERGRHRVARVTENTRDDGIARHRTLGSAFVLSLLAAPSVLLAQTPTKPPADQEAGWVEWAIATGLAVLICITAFINPKRSHLT